MRGKQVVYAHNTSSDQDTNDQDCNSDACRLGGIFTHHLRLSSFLDISDLYCQVATGWESSSAVVSRMVSLIDSSLVHVGFHPVPFSFVVSRCMFFTSPLHPLPSVPPVNRNSTLPNPISSIKICTMRLTSI